MNGENTLLKERERLYITDVKGTEHRIIERPEIICSQGWDGGCAGSRGVRGVRRAWDRRAARAERGAERQQHDAICPSRRRPLFPISGTTLRLCGPPMMAKTVLDLLHSLGVDDQDIRFDNFR